MQEELQEINNVIKNIATFIQENESVKPDFEEYIKTVSGSMNPQAAYFNYIFERNLNNKNIPQLYIENTKKLPAVSKKIAEALAKSISSVFEVKKLTKNGFVLYNIINEKTYDVTSLVKMTSFRGVGGGQFVIARVFEYKKAHYLLEISGVLSATRKDDALRFAVAKIIENPELVYLDNPEKLKEIEKDIKNIHKKFVEYFDGEEIITTSKYADSLIGIFNDFAEGGEKVEYTEFVKLPEEYKFFNVSEFNNSYENFLENSLGGFSSHNDEYDVGIIFDEELGMYAVPFYGTFNEIFKNKDYTKITNYDKCIEYFLTNDKFSANLIKRVANKYENFEKIVNAVMGTDLTLDQMLEKYKSRYLENKIVSSTTVLYRSLAFSNTLGIIEEQESKPQLDGIDTSKIGRNDPCPCGSGKKYKKCCGT